MKKMNSSHGPTMRNTFHDRLSSGLLNVIGADTWSKNKTMMHPTRTTTDENSLAVVGKHVLIERIQKQSGGFGNTEDVTFVEGSEDCGMILSN